MVKSVIARPRSKPVIDRVREKCVEELPPEGSQITTPCQAFTGTTTRDGHGQIEENDKRVLAHRVAYKHKHGPIPKGMVVMHLCDRPACCNPDHLVLGDQKENTHDSILKGRHNRATPLRFLGRVVAHQTAGKSPEEIAEATGIHLTTVKWLIDFLEEDAELYEQTKERYGAEIADEQRQERCTYDWFTFTAVQALPPVYGPL